MSNDALPPINPFAAQQDMLRERLNHFLASLHPLVRADSIRALEEKGKLLSRPTPDTSSPNPSLPAGTWPLLTLLVAQHITPDVDPVWTCNVAVAVECYVCALDLLDDVEDEDQTPIVQVLGPARALNISTTLLMLAQRAILSLSEQGAAPEQIVHLLDTLQNSALVATSGQHQDLLAEQQEAQNFTDEECIAIAKEKAGSIMRLACRLGALCAGANDTLCEQFSGLGELLGISHQLDNDAHDLYDLLQSSILDVIPGEVTLASSSGKTDLVRGKKTLPIVLAARKGITLQRTALSVDKQKQEEYLNALHEGIITTWGISLLYRERARDRLQEIEAQQPIAPALHILLGL